MFELGFRVVQLSIEPYTNVGDSGMLANTHLTGYYKYTYYVYIFVYIYISLYEYMYMYIAILNSIYSGSLDPAGQSTFPHCLVHPQIIASCVNSFSSSRAKDRANISSSQTIQKYGKYRWLTSTKRHWLTSMVNDGWLHVQYCSILQAFAQDFANIATIWLKVKKAQLQ